MAGARAWTGQFHRPFVTRYGACLCALAWLQAGHGAVVLNDPLQDPTTSTRSGAASVADGWQVTGNNDTIYRHIPALSKGAAEFDVRGLAPNEQRAGHSVRIAASPRRDPSAGAPIGAVFSNVKVWNPASSTNLVRLNGNSLYDETGPFLGLGVSYFQALRHAKYDRARLNHNLTLLAAKGFNYVRVLSMVSWDGLEIAPVTFTNRGGRVIPAWPDYWQQFRDLLDLVAQHGLRAEVTIFADAQYVMPSRANRQSHLHGILANLTGRESCLIHLEVANEAWQNGFPGASGIADLRAFTQYLADRTRVLVAITSYADTSNEGIIGLYHGSAADLATVHFSRDTRTAEGGWLPVRDAYRAGHLPGVPPVSSNEPIGAGSSVSSEDDPIKLCAAAVFAYLANLPAYVYHSRAGVTGYSRCCPPTGEEVRFEDTAGINAYQHIRQILPPDVASWTRNDGLEPGAPFTVYCNGQPNRYWPDVNGATNGCHRNIGSTTGNEFVCFPMGILPDGVMLEARRSLRFKVFHPLTGVIVSNLALKAGERFTLPQGPGAFILKGTSGAKAAIEQHYPTPPKGAANMIFSGWIWTKSTPKAQVVDATKLKATAGCLDQHGEFDGALPAHTSDGGW